MNASFEKAMKLAMLSGLKVALGPAFLRTAQRRPDARYWVTGAMAEMFLDKVGVFPSRFRLPLLIPHTLAGAWVARESMEADGVDDPMAAAMGAVMAAGVAAVAPMVRISANKVLGIPDPILGLVEDYLALKLGSDAVGLSMDEVTQVARASVEDLKDQVMPAIQPALQSMGAGSM